MKVKIIRRVCDLCGEEIELRTESVGGSPVLGWWWELQEHRDGGCFPARHFCCVDCLKKYIAALEDIPK